MDYFSKFLRSGNQSPPKVEVDHALEFHKSWQLVKNTLLHPDERQLSRGIQSTDVPAHLKSMVDSLVWESTRTEEGGTGACLEYLLKNDVLGTLVKLSETDRPFGIQAEVLRSVQNMVVLMDEQFLVHSAVHKAVLRLLRSCVGDDIQEQLDGKNRVMGAAGNIRQSQPSEYEEDLVNLLCILCSRIRNYRELLMIFFHDKQWYRPEPLFSVEEEEEEEEEEELHADNDDTSAEAEDDTITSSSNLPPIQSQSQDTNSSAPPSTTSTKKPEYEFLLFNYLLRFVHREGQIGDFARAGLLFLMDVAMSPGEQKTTADESLSSSTSTSSSADTDPNVDAALALAEYILDGDFSDVLAAGLGAVYSLLPTKLEITAPQTEANQGSTMVLGSTSVDLTEEEKEKLELDKEKSRALGVEDSCNPDFKFRLDHFLKLLEFLQDVLRRNKLPDGAESLDASVLVGSAIVQSILDAVRRVFLENVLYPSILECSDADGSAVAVMSYIEIMMRTLDNGQLGDLLIDFLLSEDNTEDFTRSRMRPQALLNLNGHTIHAIKSPADRRSLRAKRRKSTAMVLLEMEAPDSRRPSEYFTSMGRFTLKDLLLSSLKSSSLPTVTAALQLLQSMLNQYCTVSIEKLLIVTYDPKATSFPQPSALIEDVSNTSVIKEEDEEDEETFVYPGAEDDTHAPSHNDRMPQSLSSILFTQPDTTYWTHEREMGLYLTLVSRVDPNHNEDAFSTGYEHYLRDALVSIESHPCFSLNIDDEVRAKLKHRLNPNDPVLSLVLESLRKFFSNTPELNMALTGVLACLAICPDRSLAGWLTFSLKEEGFPDASQSSQTQSAQQQDHNATLGYKDDGDDRSIDFEIEEKLASESHFLPASSIDVQSRPVVHSIFHGLVSQLERYRTMVENFDQYLSERRQGLLFNENLTDALTLALELDGTNPFAGFSNLITSSSKTTITTAPSEPTTPKSKPKPKTSSSFVSFLTPKKSKAKTQQASEQPSSPTNKRKALDASPFGPHYQKTSAIVVEPFLAPAPSNGPWTPVKSKKWNDEEEDVFTSSGQWGDGAGNLALEKHDEHEEEEKKETRVTLSRLLDNVVILEESIKELVAIIHARRSLGIDAIRYL
ncbi:Retinoic acid induced 16-like protein-domain-containing protein [Abortiporus biennis]|nr:Retinoic acid induced 16-like protein-domain-containing protein [Abortiporus biennis]